MIKKKQLEYKSFTLCSKPLMKTLFLVNSHIHVGDNFHTCAAMLYSSINGSCKKNKRIENWININKKLVDPAQIIIVFFTPVEISCLKASVLINFVRMNKSCKLVKKFFPTVFSYRF